MKELIKMLEGIIVYCDKHEDENDPDSYFELASAFEKAGDLLEGFITGNFEDHEITEAQKMLEYWGI